MRGLGGGGGSVAVDMRQNVHRGGRGTTSGGHIEDRVELELGEEGETIGGDSKVGGSQEDDDAEREGDDDSRRRCD